MSSVRVRFPPSPTGYCHVGTARMAVVNYLFAKKHGGTIVFRSEDTDKERSKREFEDDIKESLTWLGLSWDEFYRQSERADIHAEKLRSLITADKAYISEEESKKEAGVKVKVVRLRNPGKRITFTDALRGEISFDTTELADFAIARSETDPLYHFAVVVDDAEMGITHVIRGEDHISNTPRQILIQEALGYARPEYAHYPLHLAADRSKLSKRKGDVAVRDYRSKGYLSEALLNYLALLGWTPPSGREILSLQEMMDEFELTDLHKSGAVFDVEKLRWFNREYIKKLDDTQLLEGIKQFLPAHVAPDLILPTVRERVHVWADAAALFEPGGELSFLAADDSTAVDATKLLWKGDSKDATLEHLKQISAVLEQTPDEEFKNADALKGRIMPYADEKGRGNVLWPLRYALTGQDKSPDPFTVLSILGKGRALSRVRQAMDALTN